MGDNENQDENAKDPRWKLPVDLPGVKPKDYGASIESGGGSGHSPAGQVVTADNDNEDVAREEQKKRGQLPLHDEEIGGA